MGSELIKYTDKAVEIVRKVRTYTKIGVNPLSISGLSLKLIKNIFENPSEQKFLSWCWISCARRYQKSL